MMNNIMLYLGGAVVVFAGIMIALNYLYEEFFRDTSPKSELRPSRKNTDMSLLRQNINYGAVGEPLLLYGNAKKKQLENDPYRLELPNYTASSEKRGACRWCIGYRQNKLYLFSNCGLVEVG